jgi:hypothetical protein
MKLSQVAATAVLSALSIGLVAPGASAVTYGQVKANAIEGAGYLLDNVGYGFLAPGLDHPTLRKTLDMATMKNLESSAGLSCKVYRYSGRTFTKDQFNAEIQAKLVERINEIDMESPYALDLIRINSMLTMFNYLSQYQQCPERFMF